MSKILDVSCVVCLVTLDKCGHQMTKHRCGVYVGGSERVHADRWKKIGGPCVYMYTVLLRKPSSLPGGCFCNHVSLVASVLVCVCMFKGQALAPGLLAAPQLCRFSTYKGQLQAQLSVSASL